MEVHEIACAVQSTLSTIPVTMFSLNMIPEKILTAPKIYATLHGNHPLLPKWGYGERFPTRSPAAQYIVPHKDAGHPFLGRHVSPLAVIPACQFGCTLVSIHSIVFLSFFCPQ